MTFYLGPAQFPSEDIYLLETWTGLTVEYFLLSYKEDWRKEVLSRIAALRKAIKVLKDTKEETPMVDILVGDSVNIKAVDLDANGQPINGYPNGAPRFATETIPSSVLSINDHGDGTATVTAIGAGTDNVAATDGVAVSHTLLNFNATTPPPTTTVADIAIEVV